MERRWRISDCVESIGNRTVVCVCPVESTSTASARLLGPRTTRPAADSGLGHGDDLGHRDRARRACLPLMRAGGAAARADGHRVRSATPTDPRCGDTGPGGLGFRAREPAQENGEWPGPGFLKILSCLHGSRCISQQSRLTNYSGPPSMYDLALLDPQRSEMVIFGMMYEYQDGREYVVHCSRILQTRRSMVVVRPVSRILVLYRAKESS